MFKIKSGKVSLETPVEPQRGSVDGRPALLIRHEAGGKVAFKLPVTGETTVNDVHVWDAAENCWAGEAERRAEEYAKQAEAAKAEKPAPVKPAPEKAEKPAPAKK